MKHLPDYGCAVVDVGKLRDYCLSPYHPEGRHKAKVFRAALGIGQQDAEWLASQIRKNLADVGVVSSEITQYGERYDVDMRITNGAKQAIVRTGWIVRKTDGIPRLVTCFVG